ncbi:MAG: glycosyltransferase [Candidatus Omnitrophica bacterium]|nr:glycosyltransferase [Candidatus Omnitrophota bacterium]
MNRINILFVSNLNPYFRGYQRLQSLCDLGYDVDAISYILQDNQNLKSRLKLFFGKVCNKILWPLDTNKINFKIKEKVLKKRFDIIWIEKGNIIKPSTLKFIKNKSSESKIISCSEDDMYALHNHSFYYRMGLCYYDYVFTTKTYNLTELKRFGARKVILFKDAYDRELHSPRKLSAEERERYGSDVGFIGTFEKHRAKQMLYLADNGIRVEVYGNGWDKWKSKHHNLIIHRKAIYGEEYVKVINATKINLCFLRKINRDKTTSRSIEIPACGGFMLAERTERHKKLFEEGREAEFFNTKEELLKKVKYYLTNKKLRKSISEAGRKRCVAGRYSHHDILSEIIKVICHIK